MASLSGCGVPGRDNCSRRETSNTSILSIPSSISFIPRLKQSFYFSTWENKRNCEDKNRSSDPDVTPMWPRKYFVPGMGDGTDISGTVPRSLCPGTLIPGLKTRGIRESVPHPSLLCLKQKTDFVGVWGSFRDSTPSLVSAVFWSEKRQYWR